MTHTLHRRDCLLLATSPWLSVSAWAQDPASESPLATALRNRNLPTQGVQLDFPALADTGNAVPLKVKILAPTPLRITHIEIVLPENPNPTALKLKLPEPQAQFEISTRLRLAASQSVWVIATYTDGSQRQRSAPTVITSTACLDET